MIIRDVNKRDFIPSIKTYKRCTKLMTPTNNEFAMDPADISEPTTSNTTSNATVVINAVAIKTPPV